MLRIYMYMTGGLATTGAIALFSAQSATALHAMYSYQGTAIVGMKPLAWIVMFAPLGLVMFLSFGLQRMSLFTAQLSYWVYAALMGLSLSTIFLTYTGESIASALFITAGTFGAMSLYGYSTKRDLTGLGSVLMMGLIGVIIASVVNLFLKSNSLQFGISIIGVLVFIGLTAYDTQKLKLLYATLTDKNDGLGKIVILGALTLYLDFINLFLQLLYLFGNRRKSW
ncbi:Bax inhibitor-1/YccA family protein [Asticcacaulis sp. EMRT-3]|nr:Bax inhibitor-1/YccA family protein [Asticcacaulis sp. EMRT-3]MDI7774767.1 Bax inhibitor-1/YccA family protein [Asticcacaulis sp. EMRT-3]